MMNDELLISLRKYKRSDKRDPIENFITEAFAWLLNSYPEYSKHFISEISTRLEVDIIFPHDTSTSWNTQVNFKGVYPDLICEFENQAIVFEHKVWSYLHENQLHNYREFAKNKYDTYYLVLISGHSRQHEQNPDLALCWYDIHKITEKWLNERNNIDYFMFSSFLRLLEYEGLGPAAYISHNAILSYYSAKNLVKNTEGLIKQVMNTNLKCIMEIGKGMGNLELCFEETKLWGRTGFGLSRGENWKPGLFIGFLINGEDHATKPSLGERSPDFCFLLSIHSDYHGKYENYTEYTLFKEYLESNIELELGGWEVYNHIGDNTVEKKNYWHPIHIRKSMLELLRGTKSADEQEVIIIDAIKKFLPIIIKSKEFINLQLKFKNTDAIIAKLTQ